MSKNQVLWMKMLSTWIEKLQGGAGSALYTWMKT
jgi:hypothetical protein